MPRRTFECARLTRMRIAHMAQEIFCHDPVCIMICTLETNIDTVLGNKNHKCHVCLVETGKIEARRHFKDIMFE